MRIPQHRAKSGELVAVRQSNQYNLGIFQRGASQLFIVAAFPRRTQGHMSKEIQENTMNCRL